MRLRLLILTVLMVVGWSLAPNAYSGTYYYNGYYYNNPSYPCNYPSYYDPDRGLCVYNTNAYWSYPTSFFFFEFPFFDVRNGHRHHGFIGHRHAFIEHHHGFNGHFNHGFIGGGGHRFRR